jgi:hypothetical protein
MAQLVAWRRAAAMASAASHWSGDVSLASHGQSAAAVEGARGKEGGVASLPWRTRPIPPTAAEVIALAAKIAAFAGLRY